MHMQIHETRDEIPTTAIDHTVRSKRIEIRADGRHLSAAYSHVHAGKTIFRPDVSALNQDR